LSDEVLARIEGGVGRLTLNRPQALHALTLGMCQTMIEALIAWHADKAVQLVLIDHAGPRGFCAGGDVRRAAADAAAAEQFFHTEYRLNHLLFAYEKPVACLMDGVVMGGGAGIALPCDYRIGTERLVFAMPEATIGLFPDVGGGWWLSRLRGGLGLWLALTSAPAPMSNASEKS
jgi:enoyl-CoA hydratase